MSKGDTTIRVDMEVAGASSAKMTAKDVYQSIESASRKATAAEEAEMKKRANAAKSLAKQKEKYLKQNQAQEYRDWLKNEQKKIESVGLLQAQRSRYIIANTRAEEQEKRRLARETAAEMKRIAREQERDSKRRMREEAREAKMLAKQRGMVGRMIHAGAMGVAGYAGVAGVANIFSAIAQGMEAVISKRSELEKAITPIIAVEDNVDRMGSIRQEIVNTSLAVGRSYEEVGRFYADLVGSTDNLSSSERQDLIKETKELAELTGGSLVTAQNLLTKSYQIYGKELVNVNQLQNKLMLTQDLGSIEFDEMALRIPELLQTGKFAGMDIDEVLGTVIGATRKSGSVEKTMTGMRNFFLIMEESQKKGIKLTGSYEEKLAQLSEMFQSNAPKMQELFGKEVVVHASSVTDAIDDISAAIGDLGKVTGDTDAVADKLAKKFRDTTYFQVRDIENLKQVMESAPNIASDVISESWIMKMHRRGLHGAAAVDVGTGGIAGGFGRTGGYIGGILNPSLAQEGSDIASSTREGEFFKQSMRQQFFDKKEADMQSIRTRQALLWTPLAGLANPFTLERDRMEVEGRQLSPHLMTEEERAIYKRTGKGPTSADMPITDGSSVGGTGTVEDPKTHQLLRELIDTVNQRPKVVDVIKPGGGRANSEETL
jgi:hypothetical protein